MNLEKIYPYRIEFFLILQILILFGSLIIPLSLFEAFISPILFLLILVAGCLLISKRKFLFRLFTILLLFLTVITTMQYFKLGNREVNDTLKLIILVPFFVMVTFELISQVWRATIVNKTVILGLISGYISLGLIGLLLCMSIELIHPQSFMGPFMSDNYADLTGNLLYYSYITLMGVGYGDIVPTTLVAKKASIFIGLIGQVYLVIITAVVVAKYTFSLEQDQRESD